MMTPQLSPLHRIWERIRNSLLTPQWLWDLVINDYAAFHRKQAPPFLRRILQRLLWFWPRLTDAECWRDSALQQTYDPSNFVDIRPVDGLFIEEIKAWAPDRNSHLLDLGCNCGRFLNQLGAAGYTNLHGVEVSPAALEYFGEVFPGLHSRVALHQSTFQEFLKHAPDRAFAVVFSRGATVELVHPSFPLVRHLTRVTRDYVLLMIRESGHSYPRLWAWEFLREGFILTKLLRPALVEDNPAVSLLVFARIQQTRESKVVAK